MSETLTPAEGYQANAPRNLDVHADVQMTRLSMPIGWVVTVLIFALGGTLSVLTVWFGSEARSDKNETALKVHIDDENKHLSPSVTREGGVVTKKTLRIILSEMQITCKKSKFDDGSEGMACGVKLPKEAE